VAAYIAFDVVEKALPSKICGEGGKQEETKEGAK